jgi:hypothetical protein
MCGRLGFEVNTSSSLSAKPLLQSSSQLFENFLLAGAAFRYPHLTAGLDQETTPVPVSLDV